MQLGFVDWRLLPAVRCTARRRCRARPTTLESSRNSAPYHMLHVDTPLETLKQLLPNPPSRLQTLRRSPHRYPRSCCTAEGTRKPMGCRRTPMPMHFAQHHRPLARQLGHLQQHQWQVG